MVTVTRENFDALLPEITDVLARASFVSFDEEMSGIEVPAHRSSRGDAPSRRAADVPNGDGRQRTSPSSATRR